ncbi:twin-arginine translocase TatA/TatE family subunit [Microbacterium sp. 18062]|uniref:twin-arginine translocase TatA/TatE family subunit n=1 Tax=Microbacterium sp. 18062 TaxID=2681410 RepID=UPI00135C7394|nr:twin-arginine translocase TatA/TatE family subunit [Microbacterium sp. 18062]
MLQNLTGWHALIILAVVLLVFGAAKLPALAKSVGQSVRILKSETVDPAAQDADATAPAAAPDQSGRLTAISAPGHTAPGHTGS